MRDWYLPARDPEADQALATELGVSPILAALLRHRGLKDPADARAYIQPKLSALDDPGILADMTKAADRLREAVKRKERIVVYGDYDVDGMTGTVVLLNFLRLAGAEAEPYIPNRLKEGYSFNDEAIDALLAGPRKPGVVVTVDHGTSAHAGIARLADAGVDVIVTDHHHPPPSLPDRAYALVNPQRPDCPSRFKQLCGAAVAFKLAWAAAQSFSGAKKVSPEFKEFLVDAMALVSLATVTDVVPLKDENRVLCFHGLQALAVSKNPGFQALLRKSRLLGQAVHAVHVGFRLGPRLNAAGRMGMAEKAIDLLTTTDVERASHLATELEEANDRRRLLEQEMLKEILALPEMKHFPGGRGICLGKPGWHVGVIGIVAARLVDRFGVPTMIVGLNGEAGRGSARAAPGVNLAEILRECGEHLVSHGGHAGAAGCTVTEAAFPAFRAAFEAAAEKALRASTHAPRLEIDLEIPFRTIRPPLVEELAYLAPHGKSNPPALFCTRGVEIAGRARILGKDRSHVAFHARHGDQVYRAVAFGRADIVEALWKPGARFDLAYRLKFDSYRDPGAIELEIEDLRPS